MEKVIYLDHAATTRMEPEVVEAMLPYFSEWYGNPSSIYGFSQKSKDGILQARRQVADLLGTEKENIYFTSGGTEADNWALKAAFELQKNKGNHIITTRIEHHAVLHTCEYLRKQYGARITYLDVDEYGMIHIQDLLHAITPETVLISVMFANNEIGTIQPIREIGEIAGEHGILFHTDAVQAYGQIPIDVEELKIDMLSSSAHKIGGPKGIGFLYIRKGIKIGSFQHGGSQERRRRAGTENVPGIIGYGAAAARAAKTMSERIHSQTELRDYSIRRILNEIPFSKLNGDPLRRLPNNIHISFRFVEGESVLLMLDNDQICASSGSACSAGSPDPSHVLLAMGLSYDMARGSIRLTLGEETTKADMDFVIDRLKHVVQYLRSMSPLYEDYMKRQQKKV